VQGVHAESGSTSRREVALAAAAALIYLAVAAAVLHSALGGGLVLSAAAGVVHDGPFPDSMRERAADGVRCLSDSAQCFVPWLRYAADALEQDGHLPLWKDTAGTGAPLLGNGQSAMFFPTNLLAIALEAPAAIVGCPSARCPSRPASTRSSSAMRRCRSASAASSRSWRCSSPWWA